MNRNSKKDIFKKKLYYIRRWKQTKIGEPSPDRLTTLRELVKDISAFSKSSSLILEVGCGSGTVMRMLESKGYKNLIGIEPVNTFLRGQNIPYMVAETMHLPLRPDSVDIIIARRFVSASDVKKTLEEIYNILKKDGKLVIDVSNVESLKSRVNNLLGLPAYPEKYYPYLHLESFKRILTKKNFIILQIKGDYVHIPFFGKLFRLGILQRAMGRKMLTLCLHISAVCRKRLPKSTIKDMTRKQKLLQK